MITVRLCEMRSNQLVLASWTPLAARPVVTAVEGNLAVTTGVNPLGQKQELAAHLVHRQDYSPQLTIPQPKTQVCGVFLI